MSIENPSALRKPELAVKYNDGRIISKREKEVLQLMAAGLGSKEIAKELSISPQTVKGHRSNIHSKFGSDEFHVNTSLGAVVLGVKGGIIDANKAINGLDKESAYSLTGRQTDVLIAITRDEMFSYPEIAGRLKISIHRAQDYGSQAIRVLNARNINQAAVLYMSAVSKGV